MLYIPLRLAVLAEHLCARLPLPFRQAQPAEGPGTPLGAGGSGKDNQGNASGELRKSGVIADSFPVDLHCISTVDSTMLEVQRRCDGAASAKRITAVRADEQVKGYGTAGRFWNSPPAKNMYLTIACPMPLLTEAHIARHADAARRGCLPAGVPETITAAEVTQNVVAALPLLVGLGVRDAVSFVAEHATSRVADAQRPTEPFKLKWPNDVLFGGKKVCGTIIEQFSAPAEGGTGAGSVDYISIGIGMNVSFAPPVADGGRPSACIIDSVPVMRERQAAGKPLLPLLPSTTLMPAATSGTQQHVPLEEDPLVAVVTDAVVQSVGRRLLGVPSLAEAAGGDTTTSTGRNEDKSMKTAATADYRKAVVEEYSNVMDWEAVMYRRLTADKSAEQKQTGGASSGSASRCGEALRAVALNEWGHLSVESLDTGKVSLLVSEYLF